jgi:hypothetical protein
MDIIGGARYLVGTARKGRMPARAATAALLVLAGSGGVLATGAPGALAQPLAPAAHGPALPGGPASLLFGLRCITAADCWAVGESDPKTEALHWNGHRWSQVPTPSPGDSTNTLDDVACTSHANCWAVGTAAFQNETALNLVLHWNGRRWSQVPAPSLAPQGVNELWQVSCISAASCWAVGQSSGGGEVLAWNGHRWSLFPGLTVEPTAVHCAPSGICWIVGSEGPAGVGLRWNGHTWQTTDIPGNAELFSIRCQGTASCWAVGAAGVSRDHNGILHWNGQAWSKTATPRPYGTGRDPRGLGGLACTSSSDCWAVGPPQRGRPSRVNEALHWNGQQWSYAPIPSPPSTLSALTAIACTSAANCWAVGNFTGSAGHPGGGQALHWNGHAWVMWEQ